MWIREALEDITAAEFASSLSVEREDQDASDGGGDGDKKRSRRAVDFENILRKIDARIEGMCIVVPVSAADAGTAADDVSDDSRICHVLARRVDDPEGDDGGGSARIENTCYMLRDDGYGMGYAVYTIDQREALLSRLVRTRERLVNFIEGRGVDDGDGDVVVPRSTTTTSSPTSSSSPTPLSFGKEGKEMMTGDQVVKSTTFDPSLYVREDGTVDWDGALQDREALKKFGGAVWSRINGQDPEEVNEGGGDMGGGSSLHAAATTATTTKAVTAKIEETNAIREKREMLDALRTELRMMEVEHIRLLNSGEIILVGGGSIISLLEGQNAAVFDGTVSFVFSPFQHTTPYPELVAALEHKIETKRAAIGAGQAVANVNFATINASLRQRIRESSANLDAKTAQVTFQTLNYELERIYTYLEGELGSTSAKGYIPLQDRLNVAEFGLLESQVDSFNRQIESGEVLDADVLAVISDQLVDFKRRLGIDYYVTGLTFDMEAIQVWIKDIWIKTKNGFTFYVKGTRLFSDDVLFCTSLILRAAQGYTLKPREVRTLR
jgi:hypothetical protein